LSRGINSPLTVRHIFSKAICCVSRNLWREIARQGHCPLNYFVILPSSCGETKHICRLIDVALCHFIQEGLSIVCSNSALFLGHSFKMNMFEYIFENS
jgi:hypothetical protein